MSVETIFVNVGGCYFETTVNTLNGTGSKFFANLTHAVPESNTVFIDRDPTMFSIVLQYLRTRNVFAAISNNYDVSFIEQLIVEATYYDLYDMNNQLSRILNDKHKKTDIELIITELKNIKIAISNMSTYKREDKKRSMKEPSLLSNLQSHHQY